MTKFLTAGLMGYILGMKHKSLCRQLSWRRLKRCLDRLPRML